MSSARARRTFVPNTPPTPSVNTISSSSSANNVNTPGLTLPQVISLIDNRLVTLEQFMKDTKGNSIDMSIPPQPTNTPSSISEDILSEFNHRFEVLTEEIVTVKDLLLKLQSYTMDVNKALYDERINIFSDLGAMVNANNEVEEESTQTDLLAPTEAVSENVNIIQEVEPSSE
jgi:hypothetical protein